jgi:O-antigen/teichoic acid export membrane protein
VDFPKYQMTSNLIKGFASNLPILLMSSIFGGVFLGQYSMGQRLLFVPISFIATALGQVHFKESTDLVNHGQDAGELTYKVIKLIVLICFVPFLIIGIWGSEIFRFFLGEQWKLSGTIVQIRSLEFMFTAIYFSTSYIFVVIKRQKAVLIYTTTSLLGSLLTLAIGGYIFHNNLLTVMLISIVNITLYIIFYLFAFKNTAFGVKPYIKLIITFSIIFILFQVFGKLIIGGIRL